MKGYHYCEHVEIFYFHLAVVGSILARNKHDFT